MNKNISILKPAPHPLYFLCFNFFVLDQVCTRYVQFVIYFCNIGYYYLSGQNINICSL